MSLESSFFDIFNIGITTRVGDSVLSGGSDSGLGKSEYKDSEYKDSNYSDFSSDSKY